MSRSSQARPYLLAALFVSLGFSIYTATRPSHEYASNKPGPEVVISVSDGEFGASIAQKLKTQGVIKDSSTFVSIANKPNSGAVGISPGSHRIQTHITSQQALEQLLDRKRFTNLVNVIEGSTLSDILKILAKDSHIQGGVAGAAARVKPLLKNSRSSLEGQLAPASYTFARGTSAAQALSSMVAKFQTTIESTNLLSGYQKYSPYEVLTIASMVQIEGDSQDYAKVAGVIYNRLKIGMALQLNSTVQYAAGLRGQIGLSTAATKIESHYNTYKYAGLPPTPISNPSVAAIRASLHPETNDFLYFITVKPHDTRFTKDYAQFENWVTEYNKNRVAGAFK